MTNNASIPDIRKFLITEGYDPSEFDLQAYKREVVRFSISDWELDQLDPEEFRLSD